jgi:integrase
MNKTMNTARSRKGSIITRRYKGGMWTARHVRHGKQFYFPLGKDREAALAKADKLTAYLEFHSVEEARREFSGDRVAEAPAHVPTVGEVIEKFAAAATAIGVKKRTVNEYKCAIRQLVRADWKGKPESAPITAVSPVAATKARVEFLDGLTDQGKIDSRKRSYNAMLRNVKAMFRDEARSHYPWPIPQEVEKFLKEKPFKKVRVSYILPRPELIHATIDALPALCESDPEAFVMVMFAMRAGLRREEAAHVRREWVRKDFDPVRIYIMPDGNFTPKGRRGYTEISADALAQIEAASVSPSTYVGGSYTYRYEEVGDRATSWLRSLGWTADKPLHELRKLFGSAIASSKGLFVAQRLLRHGDPNTTDQYYSDVVVRQDTVDAILGTRLTLVPAAEEAASNE